MIAPAPLVLQASTQQVRDALLDLADTETTAGCCVEAASLLAVLLRRDGQQARVCYGDYTVAFKRDHATGELISGQMAHAWVQLRDGTICDPTRAQFYPRSLARRKPLVLGRDDPEHDRYRHDASRQQAHGIPAEPTDADCWQAVDRYDGRTDQYPPGSLTAVTERLLGPRSGGAPQRAYA